MFLHLINLLVLIVALRLVLLNIFDLLDGLAMVDAVRAVVRVHRGCEGGSRRETEDESQRPHDDGRWCFGSE